MYYVLFTGSLLIFVCKMVYCPVMAATTDIVFDKTDADLLAELQRVSEVAGCEKADDLICPREDVTFWLSTSQNQNDPIKLDQFNMTNLINAPFVFAPLKVLIHGFSATKSTTINAILKPAYFAEGEYNIVSVDWSPLAEFPCYLQASLSVPTVARCVAQFVRALLSCCPFPSVHVLGHSLGAHVAVRASHEIPGFPRLTEFDPALPLFEDGSPLLAKGVARLVDVYHSNAGVLGRRSLDGDVDVFFNNEVFQPGCSCANLSCSHARCIEYYADGICSPCMAAFPCGGWEDYKQGKCPVPRSADLTIVGEWIHALTYGVYLMFTNSEPPFLVNPASYTHPTTYVSYRETSDNNCLNKNLVTDILTNLVGG